MKIKVILIFILILLTSNVFTEEIITDSVEVQESYKILVSTSKIDFKNAVVEKLITKLEHTNCSCTKTKLKALKEVDSFDYDVIVILNSIWAWSLNGKVKKFLKNIEDNERAKVILINTAGDEDYKTKEKDIYAITSASKIEKADLIVDKIFQKIKEMLDY